MDKGVILSIEELKKLKDVLNTESEEIVGKEV